MSLFIDLQKLKRNELKINTYTYIKEIHIFKEYIELGEFNRYSQMHKFITHLTFAFSNLAHLGVLFYLFD